MVREQVKERFFAYIFQPQKQQQRKRIVFTQYRRRNRDNSPHEDNTDLRKLLREVLVSKGYIIIEATDGEVAFELFLEYKDSIDFLILDVFMLKKNGKEVFDELRKV